MPVVLNKWFSHCLRLAKIVLSDNCLFFVRVFMKACSRSFLRAIALSLAVCAQLVFATSALAQKIDLNINSMSDIWEQIYGAAGLDPNADTDTDGVINQLEALAGTDPFLSLIHISEPT